MKQFLLLSALYISSSSNANAQMGTCDAEYEKVQRFLEISRFTAEGMAAIEAKVAAALALKDAGDDAGCAAIMADIFPNP